MKKYSFFEISCAIAMVLACLTAITSIAFHAADNMNLLAQTTEKCKGKTQQE